jgi:periplasmic protein TonB
LSCSWLPRNILLISGVAISHLLILLGLLSVPLGGEESSNQGSLIVSFLGERARLPSLKKSMSTPQLNSSSNKDRSSLMAGQGDSSLTGEEGVSRLTVGNVRQALHNPKPHYPLVSRRLKEQGLVVVKLCVSEQGIVGEAVVSKSSGFQNLDQSALKALSQWRFSPVASNSNNFFLQCFQTPVQFTLEG